MTDPSGPAFPPTVFVVDDDPAVRTALGRLLRSVGWTTRAFASADVEPDPQRQAFGGFRNFANNLIVRPPDRRREHCQTTENVWTLKTEIKRNQAA